MGYSKFHKLGNCPEYAWIHYITFGVKSLEHAWDIQSSTIWEIVKNMLGIHYITFSVRPLEYAWDIQSSTIWKIFKNITLLLV